MTMKSIMVKLDDDLHRMIKHSCLDRGITQQEFYAEAMKEKIDNDKEQRERE